MKILVMGGSYFIGWHFVLALSELGHEIFVLNRGTRQRTYPENVKQIICDRNDVDSLKPQLAPYPFDIVVDFNAFNAVHTAKLLDAIKTSNLKQFIQISSAAVYLESDRFPIDETFPVGKHIRWGEYGGAKLECETLLHTKYLEEKLPITIIRPSYVYGPENYVYREYFLFDRINTNRTILLPGRGDTILQLGHVKDLVNGLLLTLNNPKAIGEMFNLSGEELITSRGLVNLAGTLANKEVKYQVVDTHKLGIHDKKIFPFEDSTYFISIKKAQDILGFKPAIKLEDGFKEMYLNWSKDTGLDTRKEMDYSIEDSIIRDLEF